MRQVCRVAWIHLQQRRVGENGERAKKKEEKKNHPRAATQLQMGNTLGMKQPVQLLTSRLQERHKWLQGGAEVAGLQTSNGACASCTATRPRSHPYINSAALSR